jgi:delta(3,5)-delta(2,4)-dienoyl-CoA isomerase
VDIGLAPDVGSLAFLPKITGNHSLIREFTYTARTFSAAEAEKIGLLSKVVEGGRDEVVKAALELANFIATKSPVAVSGSKHLITHSRDHRFVLLQSVDRVTDGSLTVFQRTWLTPVLGTLQLS